MNEANGNQIREELNKDNLLQGLYRELIKTEERAMWTIGGLRSFLITIFTVTMTSLGLLIADVEMHILSKLGIIILLINAFLIPIYFWQIFYREMKGHKNKYNVLLRINDKVVANQKPLLEDVEELRSITGGREKGNRDLFFDFIVWIFLVGLFIFMPPIVIQSFLPGQSLLSFFVLL